MEINGPKRYWSVSAIYKKIRLRKRAGPQLYIWVQTWAHYHVGPLAGLNVNWAQVVSGL